MAYAFTGDTWYNGAGSAIHSVTFAATAILWAAAPSNTQLEPWLWACTLRRDAVVLAGSAAGHFSADPDSFDVAVAGKNLLKIYSIS